MWGVLLGLPSPSRIPLFLSGVGEKKEGKREGVGKGKGGCRPLSPSPIWTSHWGGARPASVSPLNLNKARILLPLYSRNSPVLRKIPESLETFPMSEYSLPIYRSLPLDHFETPRHVPDLIRDSEQTLVIKSHNS